MGLDILFSYTFVKKTRKTPELIMRDTSLSLGAFCKRLPEKSRVDLAGAVLHGEGRDLTFRRRLSTCQRCYGHAVRARLERPIRALGQSWVLISLGFYKAVSKQARSSAALSVLAQKASSFIWTSAMMKIANAVNM